MDWLPKIDYQPIWAYLQRLSAASEPLFLQTLIGFSLVMIIIWMYMRQSQQFPSLTRKERKQLATLTKEEQKAHQVAREFAAAQAAIKEGFDCAVFDKKLSRRAAKKWMVQLAHQQGMPSLLPWYAFNAKRKLKQIEMLTLKSDLMLRLKEKGKLPQKFVPNPAKQKFVVARRAERIMKKNGHQAVAA